jgi:hypothetical protein
MLEWIHWLQIQCWAWTSCFKISCFR